MARKLTTQQANQINGDPICNTTRIMVIEDINGDLFLDLSANDEAAILSLNLEWIIEIDNNSQYIPSLNHFVNI